MGFQSEVGSRQGMRFQTRDGVPDRGGFQSRDGIPDKEWGSRQLMMGYQARVVGFQTGDEVQDAGGVPDMEFFFFRNG